MEEHRRLEEAPTKLRILHIITTLDESSNLGRGVVFGASRLPTMHYLLQGVVDVCQNGVGPGVEVELGVQIVAGWAAEAKRSFFEDALQGCGDRIDLATRLHIWENAIPQVTPSGEERPYKRALAKQHRFVVEREWDNYDMFSAWEDDMYIGASHYQHFLDFSAKLEALAAATSGGDETPKHWSDPLTSANYLRMLPGFVRVEASLVGHHVNAEGDDATFLGTSPCCPEPHPNAQVHSDDLPKDQFGLNELIAWEWGPEGMGVRHLPAPVDNWVATVPGRAGGWLLSYTGLGATGQERGDNSPARFGQQAGWMATKEQIERFQHFCPRGFLPPKQPEGLKTWWPTANVEFWSGGFQLFGHNRCRVARVLDMTSEESFLKHMIFHTSNNKQVHVKGRMRRVKSIFRIMEERITQAKEHMTGQAA